MARLWMGIKATKKANKLSMERDTKLEHTPIIAVTANGSKRR